jgi:ABC-type branched-subunit amino acid transport system ATPase component
MDDLVIETRNLTKVFAGCIAVQDVNLRVRRGAIHARPTAPGSTTQRQALAPEGEIEDALCAGIVGCL